MCISETLMTPVLIQTYLFINLQELIDSATSLTVYNIEIELKPAIWPGRWFPRLQLSAVQCGLVPEHGHPLRFHLVQLVADHKARKGKDECPVHLPDVFMRWSFSHGFHGFTYPAARLRVGASNEPCVSNRRKSRAP